MSDDRLLVRVDSSARGSESVTEQLTGYLFDKLSAKGEFTSTVSHHFGKQPLPLITADVLVGVHGSAEDPSPEIARQLELSDQLIGELKQAKAIIIGAPVYNFNVPVTLKQYIDYICRARVTFRYTENGPVGLTDIDDAYIVVASGGTPIGSDFDFVSGYVTLIMNFIGVKNVHVIKADAMDPDEKLASAKAQIDALVKA